MKYPAAIREDCNAFPFAGLFPSYLRLLLFLRWTSYKCPHCGHVFRRDFWPGNVWLGGGERTCSECSARFDDGSHEWPELPAFRKLRFLFPPLLVGIAVGLPAAGLIVLMMPDHDWRVLVFTVVFGLFPLLLSGVMHWPWVMRSIRRYNARLAAS